MDKANDKTEPKSKGICPYTACMSTTDKFIKFMDTSSGRDKVTYIYYSFIL